MRLEPTLSSEVEPRLLHRNQYIKVGPGLSFDSDKLCEPLLKLRTAGLFWTIHFCSFPGFWSGCARRTKSRISKFDKFSWESFVLPRSFFEASLTFLCISSKVLSWCVVMPEISSGVFLVSLSLLWTESKIKLIRFSVIGASPPSDFDLQAICTIDPMASGIPK